MNQKESLTPQQSEVASARIAQELRALDRSEPICPTSSSPPAISSSNSKDTSQAQHGLNTVTSWNQIQDWMLGSSFFPTTGSIPAAKLGTATGPKTSGSPTQSKPLTKAGSSALSLQEGGSHYKKLRIQPVEYIHANNIPFIEGSIIKYVTRWRDKGGVKDLDKARHFIDLLIELEKLNNGPE